MQNGHIRLKQKAEPKPSPVEGRRCRKVATVVLVLGQITSLAWGGAPQLVVSPDVTFEFGGTAIADEHALGLATGDLLGLAGAAKGVGVSAFQVVDPDIHLLSFDVTVSAGGETVEPRDIVIQSGSLFNTIFDGSASGLPRGSSIDGLAFGEGSVLYLSLDTFAELGGELVAPGDVVSYLLGNYEIVFKGETWGVPRSTNVDGVVLLEPGLFGLSFDVDTTIQGHPIADEDILIWDALGGWVELVDTSLLGIPRGVDLDGLDYAEIPTSEIFSDGFESGDTSAWSGV
jgi:hypothetical protein